MSRAVVHRRIYLVLLALLGGCMVTSVGLSNVVWVLMLANWLLEGRWKDKWQRARESRLLQAFAVLFLVHAVALLWTSNLAAGLDIVENRLPLLAVPLIVLTTPPPQGRSRRHILYVYGITVFVVTVIGLVRWLTIPDLPHREIVTYVHHSRFSLNICMVIFLLLFYGRQAADRHRRFSILNFLLILWFLFFLLLIRSYTAFAILAVASLVAILMMPKSHRFQFSFSNFQFSFSLWLVAVGLVTLMAFLVNPLQAGTGLNIEAINHFFEDPIELEKALGLRG